MKLSLLGLLICKIGAKYFFFGLPRGLESSRRVLALVSYYGYLVSLFHLSFTNGLFILCT